MAVLVCFTNRTKSAEFVDLQIKDLEEKVKNRQNNSSESTKSKPYKKRQGHTSKQVNSETGVYIVLGIIAAIILGIIIYMSF